MKEIRIQLQPKQNLFDEAIENTPVSFFGGAKGGGKSGGLRRILLGRRLKYSGTVGAIFRKTFPELEGNHIGPLFREYPELRTYYNDSKKTLTLPNKSILKFCFAKNEADLDNHQGQEYHDLGIDEVGQWSEAMFRKLHGSNRSSISGVKARAALTGNPGGLGHSWLKRLFVDRKFKQDERPEDYCFIQAFVRDNAALMENDPDYVHRLRAEPNVALRAAYLEGDWDIIAGAFFTDLRREIHFVKPFEIPKHWKKFGAYDYGFNHPAAFGWFACDEDGNVYMYRELIQAKLRADQFAQKLKEFPDTQDLDYIVAGLDCWMDKGISSSNNVAPTIAEEFNKAGVYLSKANIGRIQGAAHLRGYLSWEENSPPRLRFFDTCPISFDCITRMEHDPNRLEDVLKVDAVDGDPMTGDDCFARGTLIATNLGQKPIELIKPGDLVWTRMGLKPVVDSWLNSLNSKTLKLTLTDGREIISTANHKFWSGDGFHSVDTLGYGNELLCLNPKLLYLMESNIDDTQALPEGTLEIITGVLETTASEVWGRCMSMFGNQLTELFPNGTTFTTKMGIRSTINWAIWRQSLIQVILRSISKTQKDYLNLKGILKRLDHLLAPGIEASMVGNGTVRIVYAPTLNEKGSQHVVWCAPENLIHHIQKELSSVVVRANRNTDDKLQNRKKHARYAKRNLSLHSHTPTHLDQKPVARFVEAICDSGRFDTYSIHVADCHEYFANGILVSNCYDMVRYAMMSRPPVTDKPKYQHKIGSPEWGKQESDKMESMVLEQFNMQKDIEKGLRLPDDPWSKGLSTFDGDW